MLLPLVLSLTASSPAYAAPAASCEKSAVDFIEREYGMNVQPAVSISTIEGGKVQLLFADTGNWVYVITYADQACTVLDSYEHVKVSQ